jgi:hypothetical protein
MLVAEVVEDMYLLVRVVLALREFLEVMVILDHHQLILDFLVLQIQVVAVVVVQVVFLLQTAVLVVQA